MEACDVAVGMISPYRERINSFLGYRVVDQGVSPGLKGRMTVINIIKNRYGQAFKVFPLLFLGELGLYSHLPPKAEDFDYEILNGIKKYY